MEKLSTLNEKLFNQNNLKKILKRGLQAGILGAALATGTVMGTGCKTDVKTPDNGIDIDGQGGNGNGGKEKPTTTYKYLTTKTLGNGNYTICDFTGDKELYAGTDNDKYIKEYNEILAEGKTYFKGEVAAFAKSLKGRPATESYFGAFMKNYDESINSQNQQKANRYFHIDEENPGGTELDATMNSITRPSEQYFADIIKNINTHEERNTFMICYRALANEAFYYGLGEQKGYYRKYKDVVNDLSTLWQDEEEGIPVSETFNIKADIASGCQQITETMDALLQQAATNIQQGVKLEDLRHIVNLSFTANSLNAIHYNTKNRLKHTNQCLAKNQIVPTMEKTTEEEYFKGRSIVQDQGMTR